MSWRLVSSAVVFGALALSVVVVAGCNPSEVSVDASKNPPVISWGDSDALGVKVSVAGEPVWSLECVDDSRNCIASPVTVGATPPGTKETVEHEGELPTGDYESSVVYHDALIGGISLKTTPFTVE